jgi:WXG100 family type VII secretion target
VAEFLVSSEDLHRAALEFAQAGKDSQAVIKRLEKATGVLEDKWSGVTQETFYKHYREWRSQMGGFAVLLNGIAQQLNAIADRFEQADQT